MTRASAHRHITPAIVCWLVASVIGALAVHYGAQTFSDSVTLRATAAAATIASAPGWVIAVFSASSTFGERFGEVALITGAGIFITMLFLSAARGIGRACAGSAGDTPDASRRAFLVKGATAAGALGAVTAGAYAGFVEPYSFRTRSFRLPIQDLPEKLDGLRMVQISDTHLGRNVPASFIQSVVDRALEIEPDVYVLTGDYIYGSSQFIEPAARLFLPLTQHARNSAGVIGVLGNHDWAHGGHEMHSALARAGVLMIDNASLYLDANTRSFTARCPRGEHVRFAGIGDLRTTNPDPGRVFDAQPDGAPTIVLAHNPDTAEHEYFVSRTRGTPRVDLMISGHTHGGQINLPVIGPPYLPSNYGTKYLQGLAQGPRFPVLVSTGIGTSGPPIRFGAKPEILDITLYRA